MRLLTKHTSALHFVIATLSQLKNNTLYTTEGYAWRMEDIPCSLLLIANDSIEEFPHALQLAANSSHGFNRVPLCYLYS